jgi:hypothetical protein
VSVRLRAGSIVVAFAALFGGVTPASAEWQLKPFAGLTFGGGTTIVDPEQAAGKANLAVGGSVAVLGEVFGGEVDLGFGPGFLETGDQSLVFKSRLTTLTGNVIVALPRRVAGYGLRPYFVGGFGLLRLSAPANSFSVFELSESFGAMDMGAGATGFFSPDVGVSWDLRHFRTVAGSVAPGLVPGGGTGRLSFWRGTMALVYRY